MTHQPNTSVTLHPGTDGVLTIWLNSPERSVNIFDAAMLTGLESAVDHVCSPPDRYSAVVFRSRKDACFFAGADVRAIASIESESEVSSILERGQRLMDRVSDLPVVTVAAIDGICMGGGLEFALACDYRIASDSPRTQLGLPEIRLGLIPGWGGTQRLPKLVGMRQALQMILRGKPVNSGVARRVGLVDHVTSQDSWERDIQTFVQRAISGEVHERAARTGIASRLLDGTSLGRWLAMRVARQKVAPDAKRYPALLEAIEAVRMSWDRRQRGYAFERDAFARLLFTPTAQSLLGLFVQRDRAKKVATWITDEANRNAEPFERIAVIGAGAMGAGIGTLAASRGCQVVFKEMHEEAAEAGRDRVRDILQKQVDRNRIRPDDLDRTLSRMQFTSRWEDVAGCELAIEAVLEIHEVKREVFQMLDGNLPAGAVLTSNTSSLSVTRLATDTRRRARVAGLHFFNPVDRMDLVEVVRTEATDEATLSRLLNFVRTLGKTPVVTADKPGFLVNRVLFPYLGEAVRMVSEGYDVALVDRQLRQFGMPMGPLELMDQVGIDIAVHVAQSLSCIQPDAEVPASLLADMVQRGWLGKKSKCGFYEYSKSKRPKVNPSFAGMRLVPPVAADIARDGMTTLQRRLVYPMMNEAVHCLDELVVTDAWIVDLAMVLGTGFAPMHGGPLRLLDSLGVATVLHNMQTMEHELGDRFIPADGLRRVAKCHGKFHSFSNYSFPPDWEKDYESRYTTHS